MGDSDTARQGYMGGYGGLSGNKEKPVIFVKNSKYETAIVLFWSKLTVFCSGRAGARQICPIYYGPHIAGRAIKYSLKNSLLSLVLEQTAN